VRWSGGYHLHVSTVYIAVAAATIIPHLYLSIKMTTPRSRSITYVTLKDLERFLLDISAVDRKNHMIHHLVYNFVFKVFKLV